MEITLKDALSEATAELDVPAFACKADLFRHMVTLLEKNGSVSDAEKFIQSLNRREAEAPTYMGEFVAIPHGKCDSVRRPTVAFLRLREPMWYESNDDAGEVSLIFMLAVPKEEASTGHLRMLANLSMLMMEEDFVQTLWKAESYQDIIQAFDRCSAEVE